MPNTPKLDLQVSVPADVWNDNRRRVIYLETLLVGVAEHSGLDGEWHDVERLSGLWGRYRAELPEPERPIPATVVPAWVMPMVRLAREASGDLAAAWAALPAALPAGVPMPGEREAARILIWLGLA